MMRDVIVNGRALSRRITGVERYTTEILRFLGSRVRVIQPERNVQGFAGHTWEQVYLPRHIPSQSILWSPANTGPLVVSNQVLTLYDLSPLEHPEWFRPAFAAWYRLFLPLLVRRVQYIVTLSAHVKRKIEACFKLPGERVIVIPGGVDMNRFHRQQPDRSLGRYLLFVGSLEPRKNLPLLLAAWSQIESHHPDVFLVLAGASNAIFRHVDFPQGLPRVQFLDYAPEEALPCLYSGADALVLPSLDEGFGLPVLEAMACGTPVLASTGGALPEVVGEAGLLFDPHDPTALARALNACLSDAGLRCSLSERGQRRVEMFSWQASAERLWQILEGCDES